MTSDTSLQVEGNWWPEFIGSTIQSCTVAAEGDKSTLVTIEMLTTDGMVYTIWCYGRVAFRQPKRLIEATESP